MTPHIVLSIEFVLVFDLHLDQVLTGYQFEQKTTPLQVVDISFLNVYFEQEKMLATKEADIIMLRENVAQLENKLHDINYDEEFLQSEISKLETDNSKLQQNYEQYEIDNRHLEMRCQQLEEELFSVQTDNRLKLDRDEGQKQEQILYLEQFVESLQRSVSEKVKLSMDLENELLALRDREQLWLQL
jgi:septal ring factor EnvC (AmiA/AmiB activator)